MQKLLSAAVAALFLAFPALAHDGIHIENAYARIAPGGSSGAVYLEIVNHSAEPDRLTGVASAAAQKVEIHTSEQDAAGVMRMVPLPEGLAVEGHGTRLLQQGGEHVMLMGLTQPLADGDSFKVELTFERGEVIEVEVTVDNARAPAAGGDHDHSGH